MTAAQTIHYGVGEAAPAASGWVNGTGLDDVDLTDKKCFYRGESACGKAAKGYAAVVLKPHGTSPEERIVVFFCSSKAHDEAGRAEAGRLGEEAKIRRKAEREARRRATAEVPVPTDPPSEGTLLSWVKEARQTSQPGIPEQAHRIDALLEEVG